MPDPIAYDELEVRLRERPGGYSVAMRARSGADASGAFELPFSADRLKLMRVALDPSRQRSRGRRSAQDVEEARQFGQELFRALVAHDDVRDVYRLAARNAEAATPRRGLRLTLHLGDAPELASVPWELLYDQPRFLSQSIWTPIVRYLDLARPTEPLPLAGALRILGMVSSPRGGEWEELDTATEQAALEQALRPLIDAGRVELHWLPAATLQAVQQAIDHGGDFHVFHYIGHGFYDEPGDAGQLVLEWDDGRARHVSGEDLGALLCDRSTLRLAVLNACEAAATSRDPLAGVATSLLHLDIPAVVGMQTAITDTAAIAFAREFYGTLAAGMPIDAALAVARRHLAAATELEWATPVLFMRVPDGRLFDIDTDIDVAVVAPAPAAPATAAPDGGELEELRELAREFRDADAPRRRQLDRDFGRIAAGIPLADLLELGRNGKRAERAAAAVGLGVHLEGNPTLLQQADVEGLLAALLDDRRARVRFRAVRSLRSCPSQLLRPYAAKLDELAGADPNANVRAAAVGLAARAAR